MERLRLRQTLITGEVALTVVLLTASGLLIRSPIHLQSLPPGFNPQGVITAKGSLDDGRYRDPAAFDHLLNESIAAMERIPSVQSAAVGLSLPYERALNNGMTLGSGPQRGQEAMSGETFVTPAYLAALEIPLLAGRSFYLSDRRGTHLRSAKASGSGNNLKALICERPHEQGRQYALDADAFGKLP